MKYMLEDGINRTYVDSANDEDALQAGRDWSWQNRVVRVTNLTGGPGPDWHVGFVREIEG